MMSFPSMLITAAEMAGMKVPEKSEGEWNPEDFPHFSVFCTLQLGRSIQAGEHWENARIIAQVSKDKIRSMVLSDFLQLGLRYQQ